MINKDKNSITVFEHEILRIDKGEKTLPKNALIALQKFYGETGVPFYSLIHNGVKFNEFVGVLQVGKYVIEVLPKTDYNINDENEWRNVLINMLKAVGVFDIQTPSISSLNLKSNSILDLYFKLFIEETEQLLHKGLIKRYHKEEGNKTVLKGSVVFSKNIQQNLIHKEKFFVCFTTYNNEHPFNAVLYKTLQLLKTINTNPSLNSRIGSLILNFPEMPVIKTDEAFFDKLIYDRKTDSYKNVMQIAKLILLNYHPDISRGKNDVLALMFDMNLLWEQFIYISLRKHLKNHLSNASITAQTKFNFWKPNNGYAMRLRPDIVIEYNRTNSKDTFYIVLDTKWKNINGKKPSPDDLRQMYTYSKYHNNSEVLLLYPGDKNCLKSSFFSENSNSSLLNIPCSIITIPVCQNINDWQINLATQILKESFTE